MIEARCFGRSEIVTPTGRILPSSELVFAVALYLCVRAGERVSRSELAETFWPHSDEVKGRHSLRQMLYRLKELGFTLDEDGELLSLSPFRVRCDLADALREDWIIEADEATIAAACDALPGFTRRFSERYGEWIDGVRARLESQFRRAALRVLADAKSEGRWYDVERWALMLLRSDPLNESAVLARAEGTAMLGSKAEAIAQLDRYLDELGPNAERIGLPAKVLRRRIRDWGERQQGEEVLPLVGREDLMRRMTECLSGFGAPRSQGFFLFGPPGIGKTRLLTEIARIAELSGHLHLSLTLSEGTAERHHNALLTLGHLLLVQRGSIGADVRALGILERATVSIQSQNSDLDSTIGTAPISESDLSWALSQVLGAVIAENKVLVTLDDAQHCSQSELELFCRVMAQHDPKRLAWCLAGRTLPNGIGSAASSPLSYLSPLPIKTLSQSESEELGQLAWATADRGETPDRIRDVIARAGGNPLFIIEIVRSLGDTPSKNSVPRTLHKLIEERVALLPPEQIEICRIVSILDNKAPLATLRAVYSLPQATLDHAVESLEINGLLTTGHSGAVSLHDCWRQSIANATPPVTLRLLATRIADYLRDQDDSSISPEIQADIGRLYSLAKTDKQATEHYLKSSHLYYARGLCQQSIATSYLAENTAATPESRLACFRIRACSEHAAGLFRNALETISQSAGLIRIPSDFTADADALLATIFADSSWKTGVHDDSYLETLAIRLAHPGIKDFTREHGCFIGLRLCYNIGSNTHASRFLSLLQDHRTEAPQSPITLLATLVHLSETGSTSDIRITCRKLRSLDLSTLPLQYSLLSQRYLAQSLRWAGDYADSLEVAHLGYDLAIGLGLLEEAAMLALQTCFTYLDLSDVHSAHSWLERGRINSIEPMSHERQIAIRHAQSRLWLLESKYSEVLELLQPSSREILTDNTYRRRIAEGACLAVAAAHCGRTDVFSECTSACEHILAVDSPSLQNDFPAVSFYRAYCALGLINEAELLLHNYCTSRALNYPRPVAPHFIEIEQKIRLISLS